MATDTIRGLDQHYAAIIGCGVAFTAAAVVTLAMRVLSKIITRAPIAWEDYTVCVASALFIVTEGLMMKAVTVGRHVKALNDSNDMSMTKLVYIYSIFYFAIISLCTTSILLLYRRVFMKPFVRYATTFLLVFTVCWWISSTIIEVGYLAPPPTTWPGKPSNLPGVDNIYLTWWLAAGVIEQVIIALAILLPMREIYRLQLEIQKRLAMMLVFAISYMCVGTGIARLVTLYQPKRPDFDTSLGDVWISAHLGTAVISANLPVCWPVFLRAKRYLSSNRSQHYQQQDDDPDAHTTSPRPSHLHSFSVDSRADTELGMALEAVTFGPTTKDGHPRSEVMARELGTHTGQALPPSSSLTESDDNRPASLKKDSHAVTSETSRSRTSTVPRWLELRLTNWRMSISGTIFSSQRSARA